MKLRSRCISCLLERASDQVELATDDKDLRFKALSEFVRFLAENISEDVVPPFLGSERNRIIMGVTSNPNPYSRQKKLSKETAEKLRPHVERLVGESRNRSEKIRRALVVSVIGNSMEFGVAGYEFDPSTFRREFDELFSKALDYDDLDRIVPRILKAGEILFLADNLGGLVLDQVLLEQIREVGPKLFVAAKPSPVQDDATLDDARALGIEELAELLPTDNSVGVDLEKAPEGLRKKLEDADLILSKGMGNYETLSEFEGRLEGRLVYLLRAKCEPVANSLGVEKGALVAKFLG